MNPKIQTAVNPIILSTVNRLLLTAKTGLILALALISTGVNGQAQALDQSRNIADKVIRETRFEYEMVPMSYNAGITRFTLEKTAGSESVSYAFGRLQADEETSGYLGISWTGRIALFFNGEKVFEGFSEKVELQEYTYNRYRFTEKIPLLWLKGENTLLVKCATGKNITEGTDALTLVMLPVNEIDEKLPGVNALSATPATPATPYTHWLTMGPWSPAAKIRSTDGKSGDADWKSGTTTPESPVSALKTKTTMPLRRATAQLGGMETAFPPEEGFRDYYLCGNKVLAWQLEEVPLLRKLVVPDSNSYTRDPYADWHYANGGTMLAMLSLYRATGDVKYLEFVQQFAGNIMENESYFRWQYFTLQAVRGSYHRINRMTMLDDSGGPALPFAELQRLDADKEKYTSILDRNFDYVMNVQERLEDKTFSRPEPYPATVWADDLFMAVPFLLRMAEITGDESLYDEVARQVIQFNHYLADPSSGLYFHGWYDQQKVNTPVRWGRANGWIVWATSEALLFMPEKHPQYKTILKIYRKHMEAIAAVQDPSGMWHQVLDHPETFEESSCTAMFTLGMARGARMGWLKKEYGEKALKGWDALQTKIREDGTVVDICRGTGIGDDVDFYADRKRFDHDPRGLGAMITAGCEISLLQGQ